MAIVHRWRLHPLHLSLVRDYLGIDDVTLPLEAPSYGRTSQQVGELMKREYSTMESLDIVADNEVHPSLKTALGVLAKPYLWVDSLWFPEFGGAASWRTVAALTEGNRVVVGVQPPGESERFGGLLTVEVHENVRISQALLGTLPPAPPGNRRAVVPESSFRQEQSDEEPDSFLQRSPRSSGNSGDQQLSLYQQIGRTKHVRVGQFAANNRDPRRGVQRSSVLRWFDNEEPDGRYLDHSERRSDTGETMYLLTPADARLIGTQIESLVASVR